MDLWSAAFAQNGRLGLPGGPVEIWLASPMSFTHPRRHGRGLGSRPSRRRLSDVLGDEAGESALLRRLGQAYCG